MSNDSDSGKVTLSTKTGFFKKLGAVLLDAFLEKNYRQMVISRPVKFTGLSYDEAIKELSARIEDKVLLINVETRVGWKDVGLVRKLDANEAHYSPSRENEYHISFVEVKRNHEGKVVLRGNGSWSDVSISASPQL